MSLKPYPTYKATNSPLVGVIPTHWKAIRLGSALSVKKDVVGDAWSKHLLLSLTLKGVIPRDMENRVGKLPADFTTYQRVVQGDLIFCLFDVEETPRTVGWVPEEGMLTGAYTAACVAPFFDSRYIAYHYLSYDQRKSLRGYYAGLRNTIRSADFANIPIAFPPLEEQQAIVSYLDRETAEIDAFTADQEELIALLGERRTATITRAVTKGLNPDHPMKDSGIEWLGLVPRHWSVNMIKHFTLKITDGAHISPETDGGIFDFVSTRDVSDSGIDFEGSLKTSPETYVYMLKTGCRPQEGDVLFSKDGTVGRTVVVQGNHDFVVASSLIIIRPDRSRLDATFLDFLCRSVFVQEQVRSFVKGAGLPRLSIANLLRVVGVFPPLSEQQSIAEYLTNELSIIDVAVSDAREAIALSKERRAAVISAAVTGKIDVRGTLAPAATMVEGVSVGVA